MWGEEAVGEEREKRSGSSKAPLNPRGNGGGVEARRKDEEGEEEKRGRGGGREEGGREAEAAQVRGRGSSLYQKPSTLCILFPCLPGRAQFREQLPPESLAGGRGSPQGHRRPSKGLCLKEKCLGLFFAILENGFKHAP